MIVRVSITLPPAREKDSRFITQQLSRALQKQGCDRAVEQAAIVCEKKSIDARHGSVKLVMRYALYFDEKAPTQEEKLPQWKKADPSKKVIIVGSGPAGLFGALTLLEYGIQPVIVERGSMVSERKKDIASISTKGLVNEDSNYCFGEGGAGTFSDGKLYTRSNKRGDIPQVLRIFVHFGADPKILTDAHPHIGTDRLPGIIQNMRNFILSMGGQILFDSRCTNFLTYEKNGTCIDGIQIKNTKTQAVSELHAKAVLLASGHSANDIYELLARTAPLSLEAKTFAVGLRVEHRREIIDTIQYKKQNNIDTLGAAEYRFTSQQDGRGVYSFCMCPGGFVVPSASQEGQLVVNGMSAAKRNSKWSNAAFVVETRPEDIPEAFVQKAKESCPALAGLYWRTHLEELTASHAQGQKAPAQLLVDFLAERESVNLPPSSYAPGLTPSQLNLWLPQQISQRLKAAFKDADKAMKGFICSDALLIASETRTSTPVRIVRDETGECCAIKGLFPAGEGSGYAGGIVSSAMDGIKVCESIAKKIPL